jgi:hypothetical protein
MALADAVHAIREVATSLQSCCEKEELPREQTLPGNQRSADFAAQNEFFGDVDAKMRLSGGNWASHSLPRQSHRKECR